MDQDLKKIKKAAFLMKKMGILELKLPDLALSMSPHALLEKEEELKQATVSALTEEKPTYTDEQVLLWSAPGSFQDEVSH